MTRLLRLLVVLLPTLAFVPSAEAGSIVYFDIYRSLNVNGTVFENTTTGHWSAISSSSGINSSHSSWIGRTLFTPEARQYEAIDVNGIVRAWGDRPDNMSTDFFTSFVLDVPHTADLRAGLFRIREGYAEGFFYNETTQTMLAQAQTPLAQAVSSNGLLYQGVLEPGVYSLYLGARIETLGGPGVNDSAAQSAGTLALTPPALVPEPATMTLFGAGLAATAWWRRKTHRPAP
jgi:hypothetical protein